MINGLAGLILRNKHTSGAGAVYILASAFEAIGPVWFPSKAQACEATAKWLRHAAVMYGLVSAGDAKSSLSKEEAETSFLKKDQTKQTP